MLPLIDGQVWISLIFRFSEVRQDILVAPAGIALGLPVIEVAFVATNVEHCIQH